MRPLAWCCDHVLCTCPLCPDTGNFLLCAMTTLANESLANQPSLLTMHLSLNPYLQVILSTTSRKDGPEYGAVEVGAPVAE
jgi:hypothetical protein